MPVGAVPRGRRRLVLLSDYGRRDELVGVLHLVLDRAAPDSRVVDLSHDIDAHDVRAGALTLWRALPWLAPAVVLAVVDPGVGGPRRAVALTTATSGLDLVGPDNGLLLPAALAAGGVRAAVRIGGAAPGSAPIGGRGVTDAGRDILASAAAALARGVDLERLGPAVDPASLEGGPVGDPVTTSEGLTCEVLWVDRFGNVQLNARPADLAALGDDLAVTLPGRESARGRTWLVARAETYADIAPGQWGILTDSYGLCALSGNQRSAAAALGVRAGDPVLLGPRPSWY